MLTIRMWVIQFHYMSLMLKMMGVIMTVVIFPEKPPKIEKLCNAYLIEIGKLLTVFKKEGEELEELLSKKN